MTLFEALAVLNIALKLIGIIDWSWAIVLWPLWAEIAIVILGVVAGD